ncbi:DNA methyltransferase [Acidihalobacter yilgarnensis]|uniref:DNA methyltransferase n=1 Tax=Acidihalobacter yilgarnensis TaxID=2819280 RepID=UPI0022772D5E|nr:DNA methyltransferase [Acidihalobacter yilgarnensis]
MPVHGAPFPAKLAEFFIKFLTVEGDLVADFMAGSLTVPVMAELLGRHWIASDLIWEYLAGGALRFPGAALTPQFQACGA